MTQQAYPLMRIFTFGAFQVERLVITSQHEHYYEQVREEEWRSRGKAQTLLKALLCCPGRQATRDQLIDVLWTESEQLQLKNPKDSLKAAIHVVRDILRIEDGTTLFTAENSDDGLLYSLAEQSILWIDAEKTTLSPNFVKTPLHNMSISV